MNSIAAGTLRLLLEPLGVGHAVGLFEVLANPSVYQHIGGAPPPTVAVMADEIMRRTAEPPPGDVEQYWLNYAVRLRESGQLIGRLEATIVAWRAEVAYLLGPQYWGQGYALEAMLAFQDLLAKHFRVDEFWATTHPANTRSIRLLVRMEYEEVRESWPSLMSYDPGDLVYVLRRRN